MITIALFIFAGLCNANMDALKFRWGAYRWAGPLYKYAGPNSWMRKYKDCDPEKGPWFPWSTTLFVFVTDFWHLSQMLWRVAVTLGAVLYQPISPGGWAGDFVILSAAYLIAFNIGFEKIFVKK